MKLISKLNKAIALCAAVAVLAVFITIPGISEGAGVSSNELVKERLNDSIALFVGSSKAYIKGSLVRIDESNPTVKPVTRNSRTLVPIRFISSNFGADVQWDAPSQTATLTLQDKVIKVKLGSRAISVNGEETVIDTAAESIGGRIFVPLRALTDALGKHIFWDNRGLIVISSEKQIFNASSDAALINTLVSYFEQPIAYESRSVKISTDTKNVKVIRINPGSPDIRFEVALPNNRLNQTEEFEAQVKKRGAFAAINANFFSSYDVIKDPIGHVMVNGKLVYMQSGINSIGFTKDNRAVISQADTFVMGTGAGGQSWAAFEVNTLSQSQDVSIMYTPERGDSVNITANGFVATVVNDIVTTAGFVQASSNVSIPANGYVVFLGTNYANSYGVKNAFTAGSKIERWYDIRKNSNSAFDWKNMSCAISGGPELVQNGKISPPSTHPAFTGSRFTTAVSPRTAFGLTADGKMLLVSTQGVTIAELKEIMLGLGAVDALNLDGGASAAMYYDGIVVTKPGRQLETILYIHYN